MALDLFLKRIWNFGCWFVGIWVGDNLLLDHDGLPHVLDLAIHLVFFWPVGWGESSQEILLLYSTFVLEHSIMLMSYSVGGCLGWDS